MPIIYKGDDSLKTVNERTYSLWVNKDGYLHFTSATGALQNALNTEPGSIQANQWYHFAGVLDRDAGRMSVYLKVVAGDGARRHRGFADNPSFSLRIGSTVEISRITPFKGSSMKFACGVSRERRPMFSATGTDLRNEPGL
jgi:hypothetical protein